MYTIWNLFMQIANTYPVTIEMWTWSVQVYIVLDIWFHFCQNVTIVQYKQPDKVQPQTKLLVEIANWLIVFS